MRSERTAWKMWIAPGVLILAAAGFVGLGATHASTGEATPQHATSGACVESRITGTPDQSAAPSSCPPQGCMEIPIGIPIGAEELRRLKALPGEPQDTPVVVPEQR